MGIWGAMVRPTVESCARGTTETSKTTGSVVGPARRGTGVPATVREKLQVTAGASVTSCGHGARTPTGLSTTDGLQAEGAGRAHDETRGAAASASATRAGEDNAEPTGDAETSADGLPLAPNCTTVYFSPRMFGGVAREPHAEPEPELVAAEAPARAEDGPGPGNGETLDLAIAAMSLAGVQPGDGAGGGAHSVRVRLEPKPLPTETESAGLRLRSTGLSSSRPMGVSVDPHHVMSQKSRGTTGDPIGGAVRSLGPHKPPVPPDKTSSRTQPEGRSPEGLSHDVATSDAMPGRAGPGDGAVGTQSSVGGHPLEPLMETSALACASSAPKGPAHVSGLPEAREGLPKPGSTPRGELGWGSPACCPVPFFGIGQGLLLCVCSVPV